MKAFWQLLRGLESPVTVGLLVLNTLLYIYLAILGPESFLVTLEYAAIPERILAALHWIRTEGLSWENFEPMLTLFSATFLHGSETHLGNNMLFLWIFGSLIERHLGMIGLIPLYLICGGAGNLAQAYLDPGSQYPIIGASGAVAGLEAVYLVLALRWELSWPHVWPMARPIPPGQLAAVAVVGFVLDILSLGDRSTHIAYGAHVGGFFMGIALTLALTSVVSGPRAPRPAAREA
jgi:membrane associated rhomboid family serine protease